MAFQKMALLALAGLLFLSALLNGAEADCGGFSASCVGPSMSGTILTASCKDDHGDFQTTSLDLNPHLGNNNGQLVPGSNYIASCTGEGFNDDGSASFILDASCAQGDGTVIQTSYNLDINVANDNGALAWNNC